jgi:hypothetical protein
MIPANRALIGFGSASTSFRALGVRVTVATSTGYRKAANRSVVEA